MAQSDFELGKMLYLLSKGDDEHLPPPWGISDEEAAAGWAYFSSLADSSGGINLDTFQTQLKKLVKRIIKEAELEQQIVAFGMMAIGTFVQSEQEATEKVSKMKSIILDKMLEATPVFAKAIFRFFGE
jgi:translation elongation factor EF-1beta